METLFTKIIIVISAIWLAFIIYYAYKNDFSSEILSFFLPALGAILLSFFVGIKFIFFDAPKDPDTYQCTVAIIHDKRDNTLYGLGCDNMLLSRENLNRPGLSKLRMYNTDEFMVDGNFKNQLIRDPIGGRNGEIREDDGEIFSKAVLDILEYNIIDWLCEINQVQGSWLNKEYVYKFPNGTSEYAIPLAETTMIKKFKIDNRIIKHNEMFRVSPVICILPSGGTIKSELINKFKRKILISSDLSSFEIEIQQIGSGSIGKSNSDILNYININNYDSSLAYTIVNYQIQIHSKRNIIFRFSKEAKLHPTWQNLVIEKFAEAYSFEKFKNKLKKK